MSTPQVRTHVEHSPGHRSPKDLTLDPANPHLGHRLTQLAEEVTASPLPRPGSTQGLTAHDGGLLPIVRPPMPPPQKQPTLYSSPDSSEPRSAGGGPHRVPGPGLEDQMHRFVPHAPGKSISRALWQRYGPPSQQEPPPALSDFEQQQWRIERANWLRQQGTSRSK